MCYLRADHGRSLDSNDTEHTHSVTSMTRKAPLSPVLTAGQSEGQSRAQLPQLAFLPGEPLLSSEKFKMKILKHQKDSFS